MACDNLRGESLVKQVIEGRIEGKRGRGKPRIMMLDDIKADETYVRLYMNIVFVIIINKSFSNMIYPRTLCLLTS